MGLDIVLGTRNKAKIYFLKKFLAHDSSINVRTLDEFDNIDDVEESGTTLEENALIKACYYGDLLQLPVISNDAGLEIPCLNNEPGVKTRRWSDGKTYLSDEHFLDYMYKRLNEVNCQRWEARMRSVVGYYNPLVGIKETFSASINGEIVKNRPEEIKYPGFPIRSVLIVDGYNKIYHDLSDDELSEIDQDKKALDKLLKFLKS